MFKSFSLILSLSCSFFSFTVVISNNEIKTLSTALYDEENGDMLALKNIKMPIIYEDKGVVVYEVEIIKNNQFITFNKNR